MCIAQASVLLLLLVFGRLYYSSNYIFTRFIRSLGCFPGWNVKLSMERKKKKKLLDIVVVGIFMCCFCVSRTYYTFVRHIHFLWNFTALFSLLLLVTFLFALLLQFYFHNFRKCSCLYNCILSQLDIGT